ncbi:Unknown protein sequence [Pseudomonas amygdali pv. lachrymans]|uniref:Uncharacterized protein n=1 Tax=Pseudomonas amygdali pv. lachrymans TaxID=53707 RepID=A0ABR5KS37_PSEAV|nr:Unknown protein sequence [Pseudomonas amygdali pv. lachrymans]
MVAHYNFSASAFDHKPHDFQGFNLLRASVNEIADEEGFPLRMGIHTCALILPE